MQRTSIAIAMVCLAGCYTLEPTSSLDAGALPDVTERMDVHVPTDNPDADRLRHDADMDASHDSGLGDECTLFDADAPSPDPLDKGLAIEAGGDHACLLDTDHRLYCWGSNFFGQAGRAPGTESCSAPSGAGPCLTHPIEIELPESGDRWRQVSAGHTHTCAITEAGSAYCWGNNYGGALGNGQCAATYDAASPAPTRVQLDRAFTTIAAGENHTCGIADGVMYCWGRADDGELGSAPANDDCHGVSALVPQALSVANDWSALVAAGQITCGIRSGAIYCWGSSVSAQLRSECRIGIDCETTDVVQIGNDTDWAALSTWASRTCAIKRDGSLWCWGGHETDYTQSGATPRHIALPGTTIDVSTNEDHTCALTDIGDLYCWGADAMGQVGDGDPSAATCNDFACVTAPTRVGRSMRQITTGYFFSCALHAGGAIYCWGANERRQLGTTSEHTCDGGGGPKPCSRIPERVTFNP